MIRLSNTFAISSVCMFLAPTTVFAQAPESLVNSAHLFPSTTIAYAELSAPNELIATIVDHPLRDKIEALPAYQQAIETPQYKQAMLGLEMFENAVGMPWREALEKFSTQGVAAAFDPATEGGAIIVHGQDAESMKSFRDKFVGFASLDQKRQVQKVEYRGIPAHRIGETRFAVYENRLLVTNNSELGKSILDRMLDGGDDTLANAPEFRQAVAKRDSKSAAWAFLDVKTVRESGVADQLYHDQINNPLLELLVGGIQSNLQHTPHASGEIHVTQDHASIQLSAPHDPDWIPEEREYFFGPNGKGRAPSIPAVDDTLLTLSTYRDFSQMWLRAGDLFNDQVNEEFAKADANLTTFFSGKDFGEDILGEIQSPVGFVMARQDFHNVLPAPAIKIPMFGIVTEMKEPEKMTREMRRTFQNLIGFFSVIGAMQGFGQLEMDMEKMDDGSQFVTSRFIPEDGEEQSREAPIVFNFTPTVGFSGQRFVVASTSKLAKQLTLAAPTDPKFRDENTFASMQANVLKQVLNDNREQLIAQNMLEEGNSREEAVAQIDLFLEVMGYFKEAELNLGNSDDHLRARLSLRIGD